jgi:hypothetical protein
MARSKSTVTQALTPDEEAPNEWERDLDALTRAGRPACRAKEA